MGADAALEAASAAGTRHTAINHGISKRMGENLVRMVRISHKKSATSLLRFK